MASVNKVILVGKLGADPETRYTQGGDAICTIRLATSESWKDKSSGEKREVTEWHRVVFYRKLAEVAGQYLKKGAQIYIEGRIKTRKWQDRDGQDRYTTEIEANEFQMLDRKPANGQQGDAGERNRDGEYAPPPRPNSSQATFDDLGDDIPF